MPNAAQSAAAEVRPVIAEDNVQGRWRITAINGRQVSRLWLELGGEVQATITTTRNAVFVTSPQPLTKAFLGCNDWYPSGWTRNGDKLILGVEMSHRTERGCDSVTEAVDDKAYAILRETMTMEFTPPSHLRLINAIGTLDLDRIGN